MRIESYFSKELTKPFQVSIPVPREDPERAGGLGEGEARQGLSGEDVRGAAARVLRLGHGGLQVHPVHAGRPRGEGEGGGAYSQDPGRAGPDQPQDGETRHLR